MYDTIEETFKCPRFVKFPKKEAMKFPRFDQTVTYGRVFGLEVTCKQF